MLYTQVKIYYVGDVVSECVHTGQAEMFAWPRWEWNPRPLVCYSSTDTLRDNIAQTYIFTWLDNTRKRKLQDRKNTLISKIYGDLKIFGYTQLFFWVLKYHPLDLVAQLVEHWTSIAKVPVSFSTAVKNVSAWTPSETTSETTSQTYIFTIVWEHNGMLII